MARGPCPRDHDDRRPPVAGQAEGVPAGLHARVQGVTGPQTVQVRGARAAEGAATGTVRGRQEGDHQVGVARRHGGRRRDRVVAGPDGRQQFEQHGPRQQPAQRRMVLDQVEQATLPGRQRRRVGGQLLQGDPFGRARVVLGEQRGLRRGRRVAQLHVAGEEFTYEDRTVERQGGPARPVRPDIQDRVQVDPQHGRRALDRLRTVGGEHGQMVAGAVGHAVGERDAQEPLRAGQRVRHVDKVRALHDRHRHRAVPGGQRVQRPTGDLHDVVAAGRGGGRGVGCSDALRVAVPSQQRVPQRRGEVPYRTGQVTGGVGLRALQEPGRPRRGPARRR